MEALNIIKYIFTIIGLGMLVGTFFIYKSTADFLETAVTVKGTVVDLRQSRSVNSSSNSVMYTPVVRFTDKQGKVIEFTSSTSSNPPSYSTGEIVEVLYAPEISENATIKGFFSLWLGSLILGGIGSVFAIVGLGFFVYDIQKKRKLDYLKLHGTKIDTEFQNVDINNSLEVNGRNPFIITTQWQDPATSKLHIFESDNIWFDPTSFIKSDTIKVLIDRKNLKKYSVDLSFLPEVAE